MGFVGDFIDSIKNDNGEEFEAYESYDEVLEEDEDEDEEEPVKKNLGFFKRKNEKEYDYDLEETKSESKTTKTSSIITPISRKRTGGNGKEVCVIKPVSFEDAREVTETLKKGCGVIINLAGLDIGLAQRIIDYTIGTSEAIDGNFGKIENYIFIVTPKDMDISGDLQDYLTNAYEVPDIKTDF